MLGILINMNILRSYRNAAVSEMVFDHCYGISMSTACVPCVCLNQWLLALVNFSEGSASVSNKKTAISAKDAFNTL